MTSKHTQGPWRVDPSRGGRAIVCVKGKTVGAAHKRGLHYCGVEEANANAWLFAAAPDLLEAAKRYDQANDAYDEDSDEAMNEWRAARLAIKAAIAKAEARA